MKSLIVKEYEVQRTLFRSDGATRDMRSLGIVGIQVVVVQLWCLRGASYDFASHDGIGEHVYFSCLVSPNVFFMPQQ